MISISIIIIISSSIISSSSSIQQFLEDGLQLPDVDVPYVILLSLIILLCISYYQ